MKKSFITSGPGLVFAYVLFFCEEFRGVGTRSIRNFGGSSTVSLFPYLRKDLSTNTTWSFEVSLYITEKEGGKKILSCLNDFGHYTNRVKPVF